MMKPIAIATAAELAECHIDDFKKPEKGTIKLYDEYIPLHQSIIPSNDPDDDILRGMFC